MKKVLLVGAFLFIGMPFFAMAQENKDVEGSEFEIIADVNISDSHLVEQKNHTILVDFTLENGKGAQSDIRYSVGLIKEISNGVRINDYQKVYDDKINLSQNSKVFKKILVELPTYLNGDYELWIFVKNGDGLPLGSNLVEKIKLESNNSAYLEVDQSTCKLSVKGFNNEYSLGQGVDISASEELNISCEVQNLFDREVNAEVYFDTFRRTIFGDKINTDNKNEKVVFNPKEKKQITLSVPKPNESQAYDALMSFREGGKDISNVTKIHFVIQGESASISNLQLDKSSYKKGEKIATSFVWSLAADSFDGSRSGNKSIKSAFYSLTITDEEKNNCINPIKHLLLEKNKSIVRTILDTVNDCNKPIAKLSIEDENGKVLAEKNYNFTPSEGKNNVETLSVNNKKDKLSNNNVRNFAWILIGAITIFGLAIIAIKGVGGKFTKLFIFIVIGGSIFITNDASALTVGGSLGSADYACSFGLSPTSVNPGGRVRGTVSDCTIFACLNDMNLKAYINGENVYSGSVSDGFDNYHRDLRLNWTGSESRNITAPNTCGNYSIPFKVYFEHYTGGAWQDQTSSGKINYSVVNCVTNGACGSNSKVYSAAETSFGTEWCSSGTVSFKNGVAPTFPNYGQISDAWDCLGSGGGKDAVGCEASRKLSAPTVDLKINNSNGPINVNRDTGSLDINWVSNATNCTKNGVTWGTGDLIPTIGNETVSPIKSGPYPRSDIYSADCYNSNGNSALDSAHATDNVRVNIVCTPGSVWSGCPKKCGLPTETESGSRINANCTTVNLGTRSCNYESCPISSDWVEVRP